MNDREFLHFLQKQRDSEDELRQRERALLQQVLEPVERAAAKMNMTLDQYVSWAEAGSLARTQELKQLVVAIREAIGRDIHFLE